MQRPPLDLQFAERLAGGTGLRPFQEGDLCEILANVPENYLLTFSPRFADRELCECTRPCPGARKLLFPNFRQWLTFRLNSLRVTVDKYLESVGRLVTVGRVKKR